MNTQLNKNLTFFFTLPRSTALTSLGLKQKVKQIRANVFLSMFLNAFFKISATFFTFFIFFCNAFTPTSKNVRSSRPTYLK